MESINLTTLALLLCAGFFAGWVDAIVGGGGLVQLPAVLMLGGITPVQALAINKMGSSFGTAASAVTYTRRTTSHVSRSFPTALFAGVASCGGAMAASMIPTAAFKPIIMVALLTVLAFTLFKPNVGELHQPKYSGKKQVLLGLLVGAVIGFYDGVLGPGTGSFLMIALITVLGFNFLTATAHTKVINLCTNLGALLYFGLAGHLLWRYGLVLGIANMAGGYLGARTAISRGNSFIRWMMVCVVGALIIKLGIDIWAGR